MAAERNQGIDLSEAWRVEAETRGHAAFAATAEPEPPANTGTGWVAGGTGALARARLAFEQAIAEPEPTHGKEAGVAA